MSLLSKTSKLFHKKYKSETDLFIKRAKFEQINEAFSQVIISSDDTEYMLPLLTNPNRGQFEKNFSVAYIPVAYEHDETTLIGQRAMLSFELAYGLVKK